jgi:hypothetical protein
MHSDIMLYPLVNIIDPSTFHYKLQGPNRKNYTETVGMPQSTHIHIQQYYQPWCNFLTLLTPSYNTRSKVAATVNVPPMTAHIPTRKPEKVLSRVSRLMTFIGEMSWTCGLVFSKLQTGECGSDSHKKRKLLECHLWHVIVPCGPPARHFHPSGFSCGL